MALTIRASADRNSNLNLMAIHPSNARPSAFIAAKLFRFGFGIVAFDAGPSAVRETRGQF
ncbi:hypothetical protein LRP31_04120 [Mesorhizobium mediterraneum]|uniref:hypothetical protein n=1 Tax=Mesorhizobium TaxID=68287 RepID=UPI00121C86FA|nr:MULTISPECIES: hypothetical protein [Mesorhizobium]TIT30759.1 MAG: hypothetical protein E5W78_13750 [Mesorhizobium sp.]WIW54436.1 hypothetical protein LRP31_04120 [Mesorhizobium mediterraneum]